MKFVFAALLLIALVSRPASAQSATQDLALLSLEELSQIETTTSTRVPTELSKVPAAVFVITQEDIRRSSIRSLPEVLRLAPGVQVARIDANKWAIGVRGFGSRLSRAMLVLIDGRAVYTPLFAGTYWEVQDTLLEDIERIEVILGPGGTLWGANAVNGIVNIITKSATDTRGVIAAADLGSEEPSEESRTPAILEATRGLRDCDRGTWSAVHAAGRDDCVHIRRTKGALRRQSGRRGSRRSQAELPTPSGCGARRAVRAASSW